MKRIVTIIMLFAFILTFCSCDNSGEDADKTALGFISAMLLRDEAGMKSYLHPSYAEAAMPNDEFYNELEENHFFTVGNDLAALDAVGKNRVENTSIDGDLLQCLYVARSNELFYDIELMILENENGYGIIAVSAKLNTDVNYYNGGE